MKNNRSAVPQTFLKSLVRMVPGNELAVVKTFAIIQEQLNIGGNQFFTVLVNVLLQLIFYF